MERRKLTLLDKLKIVAAQARCPLCDEKLGDLAGLDFDHEIALVNGGTDTLDNLRAVHREGCHKRKTHGNGATNRGSDRGEAIKTRRLEKKREAAVAKLITGDPEFSPPNLIAKSPEKAIIRKFSRPIQGANRWPPKKPKSPYRRRGV